MRDCGRLDLKDPHLVDLWFRVVQHDHPERLPLQPEVEREWRMARAVRQLGWLICTATVLGVAWTLGELALGILRALAEAGRP